MEKQASLKPGTESSLSPEEYQNLAWARRTAGLHGGEGPAVDTGVYLGLACADRLAEDWDAEMEQQLPEPFRRPLPPEN